MKKYILKKDFPGSKIGDIWIKLSDGFMSPEGRENIKMHESLFKPFSAWFEYYNEQKGWYLDSFGKPIKIVFGSDEFIQSLEAVGNHFETEKEAKKAGKKLEALTRLKDKGFRFQFWDSSYSGDNIAFFIDWINADSKKEIEDDLDLLFGGEE